MRNKKHTDLALLCVCVCVYRLAAALKDNESIYHYSIPENLSEIESKFVVKAVDFVIEETKSDDNPFNKLVPLETQEAGDAFVKILKGVCSDMSRECQEATELMKTQLSSLNLPAALEVCHCDCAHTLLE